MKTSIRFLLIIFGLFFCLNVTKSQGLPPGWDYITTPSNHIVSIPLLANPNINGVQLAPGDYIGVFYVNNQGNFSCGGAVVWTGVANTGLIAFGDDSFTPEKDGFASNEVMHYKVYSWAVGNEYTADVTCNTALPSSCTNFTPNGLSGVVSLNATGLFINVTATPATICQGLSSQLNVAVSGGSGNNTFVWTSNPPGFNSNLQNPVVTPSVTTQYFVTVSSGSLIINGSITVNVIQKPTANAGSNHTICQNQNAQLNGTATNYSAVHWSSSGDGIFSNPDILNPTYSLGPNDIFTGSALLTLIAEPNSPCTGSVSSSLTITVAKLPQVFAGDNLTVCESANVQLSAIVFQYSSVLWSTNGDGTFSNSTILNPVYTPGSNDKLMGNVQLTLTASPLLPCVTSVSDIILVSIQMFPQVNAGNDQIICQGQNSTINGVASFTNQVQWITGGDGTFANPAMVSTIYFPGTNDVAFGSVILTLSAYSISPCSGQTSDQLNLTIAYLPSVNAGSDATICANVVHQISGSAQNYDEVIWTTSGDGLFGNPNLLSTTYSPGIVDIINGEVELILTALPEFPCAFASQDSKMLTIIKLPEVNAGNDAIICESSNLELNGSANNYFVIQWGTNGDGTFSNPMILNPLYFPGTDDISTGSVILSLTALPQNPCSIVMSDGLLLQIVKIPVANAGEDVTIRSGETLQLNAFAADFSSLEWTTSGDGLFNNQNILDPIYTPGANDILNAGVLLTITASAILPCIQNSVDNLALTIDTITLINERPGNLRPAVFPNPNSGFFEIKNLNNFDGPFMIRIFTMQGILIYQELPDPQNLTSKSALTVRLRKVNNGIYFLKIFNNKQYFEQKIIVLD